MKKILYNITDINGKCIGTIDELRQDAEITRWLKRCGLTMRDLLNHPYLEDVNFLLEIRREFQQEIESNKSYLGTFAAYWDIVVYKHKPLKPKAFEKFERVVQGCILLRKQQDQKRELIKSLRQQPGTSQN